MMQEPFIVSTGRTLLVWRHPPFATSCGTWSKGGIQSVSAIPLGSNWEIAAVMRFEDGFSEDLRFSIVDGTQVATCAQTGRRMFWSNVSRDQIVGTTRVPQSHATPILPRHDIHQETFMQSAGAAAFHNRENTAPHNASQLGIVKQLEMRLEQLEKLVSGFQKEQRRLSLATISPSQPPAAPERVLQHLRGKMELILEKPVQIIGDVDERNISIRREVMSCSVDCSLGEYRDLCLNMKRDNYASSIFVPQNFDENSTIAVFSRISIHFLSFGDVCAALGECDEDKLVNSILKSRRRRTRSTPSMVRMIGDAVIPNNEIAEPFYITMGSSLSEQTVKLCERLVPVIRRKNMVRDETDMGFVHELETATLCTEHIQKLSSIPPSEKITSAVGKRGTAISKSLRNQMKGFQMRWVPQRGNGGGNIFEDRGRTLKKSGCLELLLPTIFCSNMLQCEELLEVCTYDFLKTCTQRLCSTC